jgi:hypothetical protein
LVFDISTRREVNPSSVPGPTGTLIDSLVMAQAACSLSIHVDHENVLAVAPLAIERNLFSVRRPPGTDRKFKLGTLL